MLHAKLPRLARSHTSQKWSKYALIGIMPSTQSSLSSLPFRLAPSSRRIRASVRKAPSMCREIDCLVPKHWRMRYRKWLTSGWSTTRKTARLRRIVTLTLLEDHHQKRLFPTTIGGGATTVELTHQVVERRRQGKSLKFAGLSRSLLPCRQGFRNRSRSYRPFGCLTHYGSRTPRADRSRWKYRRSKINHNLAERQSYGLRHMS